MAGRFGYSSARRLAAVSMLALLAFFGAATSIIAQQPGEYTLEYLPDGTPNFTQVLRWNEDPDVRGYEVTIQTAAGETVFAARVEEPLVRLHLSPGEYRFRIVLYNLLGKPELELPWRNFTVLRAEQPSVTSISQKVWFLEESKSEIMMSGVDLEPGAKVLLQKTDDPTRPIVGTVLQRTGTSSLRVEFSARDVVPGRYSVVIVNPGGLTSDLPRALLARYQRPTDLLVSVGYSPWVSLYDSWYVQTWPGTFFPLSATTRVSLYFLKRSFGYFGAQLDVTGMLMEGGINEAAISSQVEMTGLSAVYRYPFSPQIAAAGKIGGGVAPSNHRFTYDNGSGPVIASADPYFSTGVSVQYFPLKWLCVEAGVDWTHVFMKGFSEGGLMPHLLIGTLF